MCGVIVGVEICIGDDLAGVRRVDKPTVSDIDADMRDALFVCILEEDKVTGLQVGLLHGCALTVHFLLRAADAVAEGAHDIVDKAGAVKAARRSAAPDIGHAEILLCLVNDLLACGAAAGGRTGRGGAAERFCAGLDTGGLAAAVEQGRLRRCLIFVGDFGQIQIVAADIGDVILVNDAVPAVLDADDIGLLTAGRGRDGLVRRAGCRCAD